MKFGSLLKDHPDVLKQSHLYPSINPYMWWNNDNLPYKNIPETFDGRSAWETYIQFPSDQQCSDSWAIVATDILADRYTIATVGQINLFLSSSEVVSCIGIPPHEKIDGIDSAIGLDYKDACQGYSIYDAWEYMYESGVSETNCFSDKKLAKLDFPLPYNISYPEKIKVYGNNCSNVEGNQLFCLTTKDNKPIARRTFFANSIFNVTGKTLKETIINIKYELLRFGPVAGGFIIYENFIDEYDGKTVYEKVKGKPLGGHYVSIIGWDKDNWICRNSWGTQWGKLGFFYMKMGIVECKLEENISGVSPFYHYLRGEQRIVDDGYWNGKNVDLTNMKLFNPELWSKRDIFNIDYDTFYPKKSIELIKKGELYGDLLPLITNPNDLPNSTFYWAKDFKNFKYVTEQFEIKDKNHININYFIVVLSLLFFTIGYMR